MNRQQEIATAREVDTRIAAEWNLYYDKMAEAIANQKRRIENDKFAARNPRFADGKARENTKLELRYAVLVAEANVFRARAEEIEGNEYTGWTRFFLVDHIHNSRACHTLRPTTRIGWLPNVSGLTEAEAVKEHGATLCTVCFPSAPVELTTKAADPSVCPGSGKFVNRELEHRLGYYTGNWGTCEDCGERVTVRGHNGVKLMKHKNPNF
jgi:hypothetical protein